MGRLCIAIDRRSGGRGVYRADNDSRKPNPGHRKWLNHAIFLNCGQRSLGFLAKAFDAVRCRSGATTITVDTDNSKAAEYLFEKTDALTYLARRWGGREAIMQANLALHTLGRLRDHRFVRPLLNSSDVEARLTGVACYAFLQPVDAASTLCNIANGDPEAGVRASASWAVRFVAAQEADSILVALAD